VLALAIIALIVFLVFEAYVGNVQRNAHDNLEAIAQSKHTQIESYIEDRRGDAGVFSKLNEVWQFFETSTSPVKSAALQARLKQIMRDMQSSYDYRDIRLLDPALNTVFSLRSEALQPAELTAFKAVVNTHRTAFVDMHLSPDGAYSFGIAEPIFEHGDRSKKLVGIVYLESDASVSLFPRIDEWPLPTSSGESLLFRRAGADEIVFLKPLRYQLSAAPLSVRRPITRDGDFIIKPLLNVHQLTSMQGRDYRGIPVLAVFVPIVGTNWFLEVKVDYAEIAAPIYSFAIGLSIVAILLLALLGIIIRLIVRAKHAEFAAAQAALDARYLAARKASIDGYLVINDTGHILEANNVIAHLSGYSIDELCQKTLADVDTRYSSEEIIAHLEKIRDTGGLRFQSQWRCKDGSLLDFEVSVSYVLESGGGRYYSFLHDIGDELAARRRIERLNYFYIFLSNVNTAIFNLRDAQEILEVVCKGAVRDGGFILAWAGVLDEATGQVKSIAAHGVAVDYVKNLIVSTDPTSLTSHGPTRMCMLERHILWTDDFQSDNRTAPWHDIGREYGINASASVPILVNGKVVAALCFYSATKNYFDPEFRMLLEEVARNVSLAMETASAINDRQLAEAEKNRSEQRFRRAFDASPIPVQIYSLDTRMLRSINKAHERTFGYSAAELQHELDWFDKIFPDPVILKQVKTRWEADIQRAILAGPTMIITSPELSLPCKDGTILVVRAFMSVTGDDIVVQWENLTDIKKAQADLVENEEKFRNLIEQTLTGIYVTQDRKIVYANPRLTEILGWRKEELLGKDSLEIFADLPESKKLILDERAQLDSGARSVARQIPYRSRDGKDIVLGIHASIGVWDGRPCTIVMCQDITERKHAEEKIAAYITQLEGTMRGTLQAVANMVDMRDPYTAGHERRVGIIAADIAREMGWAEEKCQNLQLIGLVHDIGKIAIPAEILSKPGRLTPLEYQIIQTHAEKGYEILKHMEFPLPIAEIIREHHERMDGSGYPQGLKGENILPEARILAVADVLESMASHRPYRPALGLDAALKEIEGHRITWFDPDVVDAMLRLLRDKGYQIPD